MASSKSKIVNMVLRKTKSKQRFDRTFESGRFGEGDIHHPPKALLTHLQVETQEVKGRNVFILTPKSMGNSTHILYLHGGGYIHGFDTIHWSFLHTLVQSLHCTVVAPDYPVAPAYTYKDAFDMVIPVYEELVARVGQDNIILMGDSAGGGMALALAQKMLEIGSRVRQAILISPWLDITMTNPAISELDPLDPMLGISGLIKAGLAYAGDTDPNYYLLSPINGPIEGLPPLAIFIGDHDILLADVRKFKAMLEAKGIAIDYVEAKDMIHVWPLLHLPESKIAIEQIRALIEGR